MKRYICFSLIFLALMSISTGTIYAQDPQFSQPYANPLYLNPAFAGTGADQRIGINDRDQWPNIPGGFETGNLSYDRNIIDTNNGIGILGNVDNAGSALKTYNISLIYAHQFHINSFTLSAGAQATYHYISVDESQLSFGSQVNPVGVLLIRVVKH